VIPNARLTGMHHHALLRKVSCTKSLTYDKGYTLNKGEVLNYLTKGCKVMEIWENINLKQNDTSHLKTLPKTLKINK
jgi:hypothetical protein